MNGWFELAPFFAKRSTQTERFVIVWIVILLATAIGLYCLYLGFTAAPAKAAQAAQLRTYGFGFVGFAGFVWLLNRFVAWFLDR